MTSVDDVSRIHSLLVNRRSLLALGGSTLLLLAGCGDSASNRQFAGGPQTALPNRATPAGTAGSPLAVAPTAIATAMPIEQLLGGTGTESILLVRRPHDLTAIDVETGHGQEIWSNPERAIWAADADSTGTRAALLTSSATQAENWSVDFVDVGSGKSTSVPLGLQFATPEDRPDLVTGGRGGIAWLPDGSSVAVAIPSGGLWQIYPDGSQVKLVPASSARRPAEIAISADGGTLAFVDQPSGADGSGVLAGSLKARPIDPIVVLPADRSGNRYAHGVEWIPGDGRIVTIIERQELGSPQGDLFYLDPAKGIPGLAWTSPPGRETASVESFAVSSDGRLVAFLTNASRSTDRSSAVWLMQIDGPSIERFDLPERLTDTSMAFTPRGVVVAGLASAGESPGPQPVAYLINRKGKVVSLYSASAPPSPSASPVASPVSSPPSDPSPVAATPVE